MTDLDMNYGGHVVVIIGGATAGSAAAEILADQGARVIVLEQNVRPYGKIEDGLPRWHTQQRRNEYQKIDTRLAHPGIYFVPQTRLGRDLSFDEVTRDWGLSAVLLANGAWKDRPLPVTGADAFLGRGLVYQNSLIYWFNHKNEKSYDGPRYVIPEGAIVVGGGLASIDVIKVVQLELYERALRARGVEASMYDLEHKGIPEFCKAHGVNHAELGVRNGILFYRRRVEDMPLASIPDGASPEKVKKTQEVRRRLLNKCQEKYLLEFHDCHAPAGLIVENDRMVGLRFVRTQVDDKGARPIPGTELDVRSELTISSIGSIPEPISGIEMKGEYYTFRSAESAEYSGAKGVFGAGNVVTGKGNIRVSLEHGEHVAHQLVEQYLGLSERQLDSNYLPVDLHSIGNDAAQAVLGGLAQRETLSPEHVERVLKRVRELQQRVGYTGDYTEWIRRVTPEDLE